mmetsp:Transcript_135338/g.191474  ORF Transcript_135338/g.191474 Transcript_135338/m.191474 type:complete len:294 (-) Transcript_135338:414-1295(-)
MIEALEARAHKRCSLTAITSDVVMLQEPQQEWAESFQGRQQLVLLLEESSQKLLLLLNLQRVQAPHQRLQEEAGSGPRAVWALQQELKLGLGLGKAVSTKQRCQLFHGLLQSPLDGGVSQSSCEAMPQVLRVACYHVKQLRQLPGNHAGEDFRGQDRLEPSLRAFLSSLLLVRGLVEGRTVLSRLGAGIAAEDVVPAGAERALRLEELALVLALALAFAFALALALALQVVVVPSIPGIARGLPVAVGAGMVAPIAGRPVTLCMPWAARAGLVQRIVGRGRRALQRWSRFGHH